MPNDNIALEINPYTYPSTETYQSWLTALKQDWCRFREVAGTCVSPSSFHAANQTLGYNLGKATPVLILELERRELHYARVAQNMMDMTKEVASERRHSVALQHTIDNLRAPRYEGDWWED